MLPSFVFLHGFVRLKFIFLKSSACFWFFRARCKMHFFFSYLFALLALDQNLIENFGFFCIDILILILIQWVFDKDLKNIFN